MAGGKGLQRCANRLGAFVLAVLPACLLLVSSSFAASGTEGPTRSEYVEQVEPICKSETQANRTVLQGVDEMISEGKLKQAAPRMARAATALRAAVKRVAAVPRPPRDAERLARWLELAKNGNRLLQKMALEMQQGDRPEVQALADDLLRETKRANATVVGFNFEHCRMTPARFV